jgi:hypothetical protein
MRHFPLRELGYAIGFLVLLAVLYVGSYCAMVERRPYQLGIDSVRYPDAFLEEVFSPIHQIDRVIRPEFWSREIDLRQFDVSEKQGSP